MFRSVCYAIPSPSHFTKPAAAVRLLIPGNVDIDVHAQTTHWGVRDSLSGEVVNMTCIS
ncbi:hypothetical protein HETIRDRAFT_433051, partial [Heterobasidion irregulare TC 32-1]